MANNFNLLRLLFALAVVVSHSAPLLDMPSPLVERYLGDFIGLSFGGYAVHGFFAISGYLITKSYLQNPSLASFSLNRTLRLVPALLVAVPLGWLVAAKSNSFSGNISSLVNGSLWTLNWEACCYVAAGLLGSAGVLSRRTFPAFFAAAVLVYISRMGVDSETFSVGVSMLMLFLVGGFVAVMGDEIPLARIGVVSLVVHAAMVIQPAREALLSAWSHFEFAFGPKFTDRQVMTFVHLATYPFIVLWLGMGIPQLVKIKTDISYGVYIYAWPLQQAVVYWMREAGHPIGHPLVLIAWVLPPLLLLSYLSWILVERPALSLKRRASDRRHSDLSTGSIG